MKKLYFQKFLENKPYVPLLDGNNHIGSVDESNQSINKLPNADFDLTILLDYVTNENLLSKSFIKDLASLLQSMSAPWNYIVPIVESTILLSEDVTFELNKDSVENLLSAYATLYPNPYERYLEVVTKPQLINPKDNHTRVYFTNKFNEFKSLDKEDTYAEFTLSPEDMVAKSKINVVAETLEEQNRNIMRKQGDSNNETNKSNAEIPKEQSNGFSDSPKEEGVIQEQEPAPPKPDVEEFNEQQTIEEVQEMKVQEQTSDKEVTLMSNENNGNNENIGGVKVPELNFGSTPLDLSSSALQQDEVISETINVVTPITATTSLPESTPVVIVEDELEDEELDSEELPVEEQVDELEDELEDEELEELQKKLESTEFSDEEIAQQEIEAEQEVASTDNYINSSQAAELSKMIQQGKSVTQEDIETPVELPEQEGSVEDLFANSKLTEKAVPKKLHNEDFSNAFSTSQSGQVIKGIAESTEEKVKAAQDLMSAEEPINKRAQSPINKEELNEAITRNEPVEVEVQPESIPNIFEEELATRKIPVAMPFVEPVIQSIMPQSVVEEEVVEEEENDEFDYSIPAGVTPGIPTTGPVLSEPTPIVKPKLMPAHLPETEVFKKNDDQLVQASKEGIVTATPSVGVTPTKEEKTPPTYKELEETIREVSMKWSTMLDEAKERHKYEITKLQSQHEFDLVRQRETLEEERDSVKHGLQSHIHDLEQQLKSLSGKKGDSQAIQELNLQISNIQLSFDEERQQYLERIRELEERLNNSLSELSKFKSDEASTKPVEHLPVKKVADVKRYQDATRKFLNESTQGNITLQDFYSIKQEENVFPKHGVTGVIIKPKKG